jgi:phage FluMu gp28-like protein
MIRAVETDCCVNDLAACPGDLYVGVDVGRKKHLTVIWVLERVGGDLITRAVRVMENTPFREQHEAIAPIIALPRVRRACMDDTGLGMQLAEGLGELFGSYRVEPVTFSGAVKERLAGDLRLRFEDRSLRIPSSDDIREDLHAIRRMTTVAGNVRLVADTGNTDGHADRFWALALAVHAADGAQAGPLRISTRRREDALDFSRFGGSLRHELARY